MHDPWTVAFHTRWPVEVTIWHVDPETDGTDDSCGFSRPKLTKRQRDILDSIAGDEGRYPWFRLIDAKSHPSPSEAETLLRGAFLLVSRCIRIPITLEEATLWTIDLIHNPIDNLRSTLCCRQGYHTNGKVTVHERTELAKQLFYCVAKFILREKRKWWQHPKWHFWHWEIKVSFIERMKRRKQNDADSGSGMCGQ